MIYCPYGTKEDDLGLVINILFLREQYEKVLKIDFQIINIQFLTKKMKEY